MEDKLAEHFVYDLPGLGGRLTLEEHLEECLVFAPFLLYILVFLVICLVGMHYGY